MCRHEAHLDLLPSGKGWHGLLYFTAKPFAGVVGYPLGEIVQPADILWFAVLAVAYGQQIVAEILEAVLPLLQAHGQRHHILHIGGAVELSEVHHQLFLVVHLKGVCHIRQSQQLASKVDHGIADALGFPGIAQQPLHLDTVLWLIGHLISPDVAGAEQ